MKKDEVSAPVRTEFGWHLIKLLGVQAPEVPTLASMKEKLETDLKTQRVEQRFVEAASSSKMPPSNPPTWCNPPRNWA